VGCVGIVRGEEPVLVALAPRRDVVAARVLATLRSDEAHRRPELWLTLPPGAYLGKVVDPFAPFVPDDGRILDLIRDHGVGHALLAEVRRGAVSTGILLTLYASRPDLQALFRLARNTLADLPGWVPMR
jgi:hypothetical protein